MKKRDLRRRIEQLERRVHELEAGEFKMYPPVWDKPVTMPGQCTCGTAQPCPVHGYRITWLDSPLGSLCAHHHDGPISSSYVVMTAEEIAANSTPTH